MPDTLACRARLARADFIRAQATHAYRAGRTRLPRPTRLAGCLALALAVGLGRFGDADAVAPAAAPALAATMPGFDGVIAAASASGSIAPHRRSRPLGHPPLAAHALPPVPAGSPVVTNCDDSGPGSLRDAVDHTAVSGDTIDLTHTGCSAITLTTGSIAIAQADLTLQGPGAGGLAINGDYAVSPLRHAGSGTLSVNDLSIFNGHYVSDAAVAANAKGGCIFSAGTVALSGTAVEYCDVAAGDTNFRGLGGGVYAQIGITLANSSVSLGRAGGPGRKGHGGGIHSTGTVSVSHSYIGRNYAQYTGGGIWVGNPNSIGDPQTPPYPPSVLTVEYSTIAHNESVRGGGISALGAIVIDHSTLSDNTAVVAGGVLMMAYPQDTAPPPRLQNSTVSGNSARLWGGVSTFKDAAIANSTIAFNTESQATDGGGARGAGLYAYGGTVDLQSTIIANNTLTTPAGPLASDVGGTAYGDQSPMLTGANNLIMTLSSSLPAPADTLALDPLLAALADHGGPTSTHALGEGSPAISAGNNAAASATDQRGAGFPRTSGAATDIGAFETTSDSIFADGFD